MACFPCLPPERVTVRLVLHSSTLGRTRTAAVLLPSVRPSPAQLPLLPYGQATTAEQHAGSRAPALAALTTRFAAGLPTHVPPPPPAADSRRRKPTGCPPSPQTFPVPLAHTRGGSPALRGRSR